MPLGGRDALVPLSVEGSGRAILTAMADDIANLTVEILKQIRDGVHRTNERLDQTNQRLDQTNERLEQGFAETNRRLSKLEEHAIETNKRLATVENVLMQHGRIVDGVRHTSLEDLNRFDVLEGRVASLEAEMHALRNGQNS
jgi:cell division protein FtsB